MARRERYPEEELSESEDDGTMPANVDELTENIVGRRIVSAENIVVTESEYYTDEYLAITLDDGRRVKLHPSGDCCAFTELESFLVNPELVDHMILGVGTTGGYTTWHIYADLGDIMQLKVNWSAGNTGYYGYGFHIQVEELSPDA